MTTDAALLQAILAAPDDDAPRLAYADHLEGRGEPERATCQLARLPDDAQRRPAREAQERTLLQQYQKSGCVRQSGPLSRVSGRPENQAVA